MPRATAVRLARGKAAALAPRFPDALIIGSDQVAELDNRPLGKPLTPENTVRQLRLCSGRTVDFHTGLCLLNAVTGEERCATALNRVRFRRFGDDEIERYLQREQPYDCTGGAKADAFGVVLIAGFEGIDPNALIGLPLLLLAEMLRDAGFRLP
jgi:septum formation protein